MKKSLLFNNCCNHPTFCSGYYAVVIIFLLFVGISPFSSSSIAFVNGQSSLPEVKDDRRMNIYSYVQSRQAFLIFETPFLEIFNKFEQQGYKDSIQQMVTTLYWLGPPTYKVDDDGNVDTIVSRVIEYVYNPDVADPNNLLPNNLKGVTEKLNSAGFAGSWNNVLEFYESVIIDLDPYDTYDKSQYRWSEAGYPTASIIEFEPADFIGAVKARWVFSINNTTNTDTTNTALQQLQNDLGGQLPTPALFDILYNDITSSPNPNQYPSNHNNNSNNNGNKYVKKEKSQKEKSSKSSKKTKNRFWE